MLKTAVARFALSSPDPAVRLDAVKEMMRSLDEASIALLRERIAVETDRGVKEEIETGLALAALDSGDPKARLEAIATLGRTAPAGSAQPAGGPARAIAGRQFRGKRRARSGAAAADAVRRIDRSRTFYSGIETLFFGLSLGSVLVLVAIGLAITFGVMGVINMAHGELMMLGAYTTYVVQLAMPNHIGLSILVAIPAAFLVAGPRRACPRAHDHPLPLRPAARDAARDLRRQPRAAAARPLDLLGEQPLGRDAGLDERHAADQRSAGDHLQPPLHRHLHADRVRASCWSS